MNVHILRFQFCKTRRKIYKCISTCYFKFTAYEYFRIKFDVNYLLSVSHTNTAIRAMFGAFLKMELKKSNWTLKAGAYTE